MSTCRFIEDESSFIRNMKMNIPEKIQLYEIKYDGVEMRGLK